MNSHSYRVRQQVSRVQLPKREIRAWYDNYDENIQGGFIVAGLDNHLFAYFFCYNMIIWSMQSSHQYSKKLYSIKAFLSWFHPRCAIPHEKTKNESTPASFEPAPLCLIYCITNHLASCLVELTKRKVLDILAFLFSIMC